MINFLNDIRNAENPISNNRKLINTIAILFLGIALGTFSKYLDFRQTELPGVLMAINGVLDIGNFLGRFAIWILIALCISIVADGLFCREIDGLFCRSSPDIIVRRRCVLSHKRRGWLQPSPSFRYSRNLALQDELYHPVINNGPAVLVCVDKRLGTGPVNQSRDAG